MSELNRNLAPEFKTLDTFDIIEPEHKFLSNQIPVYTIHAENQEAIKLELIFNAGSWFQPAPLVASALVSLLQEGTKNFSSTQIAEKLDYYGASISSDNGYHNSSITLICLSKHVGEMLELFSEIIKYPIFPEREFNTWINKRKQRFLIENQKVDKIARNKFHETLFGSDHPYGYYPKLDDFDSLKLSDIENMFQNYYHAGNCRMYLAGNANNEVVDLIDKFFGNKVWEYKQKPDKQTSGIFPSVNKKLYIEKDDAVQSAIRIGKICISRNHPDYSQLVVVNTILGGYFGSRLMSNIREDKGYTYGIGSSIVSMLTSGYFVIGSEVGKDVCKDALNEIYHEIRDLRENLADEDELETVKSVLLGDILRSFDGPFETISTFKSVCDYDLTLDFYRKSIIDIKSITVERIQELANKYFHEDTMIEVVAG